MKQLTSVALMLLASLGTTTVPDGGCPNDSHSLYSRRAISLNDDSVRIPSPDGTKVLTVKRVVDKEDDDGMHLSLMVSVAKKNFHTRLPGFNGEVLWAGDSSAFAANLTQGGGGIGERAYVFYVGETGLKKIDISTTIEKAFGSPVKCEVPVLPNTGFVEWLNGTNRILAVAEVVPVSICSCMGMFKAYELSLPDVEIVRTYSQTEAKQRFSNLLGCELRGADEKCSLGSQR